MSFHAYLSNRMSTPDEKPVTVVAWNRVNNLIACGQTNGTITIAQVKFNSDHPGLCKFDIVLTLVDHKHEVTALTWNERFNKLTSGDADGLLIVWTESAGKWRPNMINNLYNVPITSLMCSPNGELISITYADGRIICGDVSGNQRWTTISHNQIMLSSWSPSAKTLFVSTKECTVMALKSRGQQVEEVDLTNTGIKPEDNKIITMQWSKAIPSLFMMAFQCGRVVIMTSENDVSPVIIDADFRVTAAAWSNSGAMVAITGIVDAGHCQLRFYSATGKAIRTLTIPAQNVSSVAFNQTDDQLVLGVDHSMCLAQIVPINPWGYIEDTIVYAYKRDERTSDSDVIFFNSKTSEKHVKKISNLKKITASGNKIVLASRMEGSDETALVVCDKIGIPSATTFVPLHPDLLSVSNKYVVACSEDKLAVWGLEKDEVKLSRLKHCATAIEVRESSLFVAYSSNELVIYSLPNLEENSRYNLTNTVESIAVSSDLTRLSMIDIYGNMTFLDVHSGTVAGQSRKEAWCMKWADDSPDLFVSLESQKLYIYRQFEIEEPIISLAHVCSFNNLVVTAVDFILLYQDPMNPKREYFHVYESKSLRDTRGLLQSEGVSQDEILAYIKEKSHPRLWLMNAEANLKAMNLQVAERCFIECQNNPGILFMKKITSIPKGDIQRGYVYWYLKQYDEAEKYFAGTDIAVQMYATVGKWSKVAELVSEDDEEMYVRCHTTLGNEAFIRGDWKTAAEEYELAGDYSKQLKAFDKGEDFQGITTLMNRLPKKSPLLEQIGYKFIAFGSHEKAVEAFMKFGSVNKAIDACCHLNQWNAALQLATENKSVDKRSLMGRYAHHLAGNSHISTAINMFVKFDLPKEAAELLEKEGDRAFHQTRRYVFSKKCFVFAADLMEKYAETNEAGKELAASLWHKAEAVHFLLLAHQQLYNEEWDEALGTSTRLYSVYVDYIGKERAAALLALCGFQSGYLKQCSTGFIQLENSPNLSKKKRDKISHIAVKIFGKHPPNDPPELPSFPCKKCKSIITAPTCRCQCGFTTIPSIASGKSIFSGVVWKCPKCKHFATQSEIANEDVCPLCHVLISKA